MEPYRRHDHLRLPQIRHPGIDQFHGGKRRHLRRGLLQILALLLGGYRDFLKRIALGRRIGRRDVGRHHERDRAKQYDESEH